jgi:hypothetical protein
MTTLKIAVVTINNSNKYAKENSNIVEYIYNNIAVLNKRGVKFNFVKKHVKMRTTLLFEDCEYKGFQEIVSALSDIVNKKPQSEKKEKSQIVQEEFSMERYMEKNASIPVDDVDDKTEQKRKDRAAEISKHRELSKPKQAEKKEPVDQQKNIKTSYDDIKDNLSKSGSVSFSDNPEIVSFLKNKTKNMTTEDLNDYNLLKSMGESNAGLFN